MSPALDERVRDGLVAGAIAGIVSGAPSTLHAIVRTGRPLAASYAAGAMVVPRARPVTKLLVAAPVHASLSLGWGVVLSLLLPRRRGPLWGAAAGLAIAGLDLGLIGRRFPEVAALPPLPQVADHVAYGAVVGAVLERRARNR